MKTEDIDRLNEKIKLDFGVDLKKYRNPDAAGALLEMLAFPMYALYWVIQPIIVALVLFVLGIFILEITNFEYFLYYVVCFLLFLILGVLIGIVYFLGRFRTDLSNITQYSFDLFSSIIKDVRNKNLGKDASQTKDSAMLYSGVIHIVITPMLITALDNKYPVLNFFLSGIIARVLASTTKKIEFDESFQVDGEDDSSKEQIRQHVEGAVQNNTSKIINIVLRIIRLPLLFVIWVLSIFLAFLLYVIW